MKSKRDAAKAAREAATIRSRQQFAAVADIGELPKVKSPKRKESCRLDLEKFLTEYFPASTGLWPFGYDHIRAIARIQQCALEGGLFVQAFPRGYGKTTISENAAIWATVYGHRRFVPIFGADANSAAGNIGSIKLELGENDLLYEDFPEVCHAIRALEGKAQRCASQMYQGQRTHIEWTADQIVLPVIPKSAASGAVIAAYGLTGTVRGMKHKRPDGTQQRPDFVLIDDPQSDESASTELQVNKRLDTIRKSILKLGGHNRKIAVVINATVIQPDDLVEQMLDPKKFPAWQGERIQMVRKWSDVHETLWLDDYARIRNTFDQNLLGDQRRAHKDATDFYVRNREKMDAGCEVSWGGCYDRDVEVSAIQHAYNALIDDGPEVFASECQNQPVRRDQPGPDDLTADKIAAKLSGVPRGAVPIESSRVVAFIDVQKDLLYWVVAGFGDGFCGNVIDYGTFPDQKRAYFGAKDVRFTLQKTTRTESLEASIYAGLDLLTGQIMAQEWIRDDDAHLKPERILIDAGWGDTKEVVHQFCRQSPHAAVLFPSIGRYIGATSQPFNAYKPKRGDRTGINWRIPAAAGKRATREVQFDANAFKTFVRSRLLVPMGAPGCLSLFGKDPAEHRLFADHLMSEQGIEVTAKGGRTVVEWKLRPNRPDNHLLDCLVGCHVAAAIQGVNLRETTPPPAAVRRRVKFSELQKKRRMAR